MSLGKEQKKALYKDHHECLLNQKNIERLKKTLRKHTLRRSPEEVRDLIEYFENIPFLKKLSFDRQERTELANLFKIETFQGMDNVMNIGDEGDKFYIIIQGVVSIQVHNLNIFERRFKRREYDNLI